MEITRFDPAHFSPDENKFLLEHLGEPWIVASKALPARDVLPRPHPRDKNPTASKGVNPSSVKPIIDRIHALAQSEEHDGSPWVGLDAVREAISTYIAKSEQWIQDQKRGGPRFPTMYTYGARGRRFLGGPGSDSSAVKTYFDASGNRVPFAIDLIPVEVPEWNPAWLNADQVTGGLVVNNEQTRIECFCGHTEKFKAESRSSYVAARGRMSRHLRSTTDRPDQHREVYTIEFGSGDK